MSCSWSKEQQALAQSSLKIIQAWHSAAILFHSIVPLQFKFHPSASNRGELTWMKKFGGQHLSPWKKLDTVDSELLSIKRDTLLTHSVFGLWRKICCCCQCCQNQLSVLLLCVQAVRNTAIVALFGYILYRALEPVVGPKLRGEDDKRPKPKTTKTEIRDPSTSTNTTTTRTVTTSWVTASYPLQGTPPHSWIIRLCKHKAYIILNMKAI